MSRAWKRRLGGVGLSGLLVFLAFAAAGCGGGGGGSGSSAEQISGLGTSLDDIKQKARDEGEVNLVIWSGYADPSWAKTFTQQTGCTVNTKDGASSDDMIDLLSTGQYDGVSASGNASVRLMARGDVAPINTDYIPNYADVQAGIKNQSYNSLDGKPYGVPHGRGPNLLMFRTDAVPKDTNSWAVIWDKSTPYKGKISIYDDSIFIADAAVYLKATQPDLEIDNPYELDDKQFNAAVDLLKKQAPKVSDYWPDDVAKQMQAFANKDVVVGTTWPYQVNLLEPGEGAGQGRQAEGGHDRLVGHLDDRRQGPAPELHVPLDELHHLAGGAGEGRRVVRRGAGQPEGLRADGRQAALREVPRPGRVVVEGRLLLDDADRGLR